jgi:hypothetical protein
LIKRLESELNSVDSESLSVGDFLYLKIIELTDLSLNMDRTQVCYTVKNSDEHKEPESNMQGGSRGRKGRKNEVFFTKDQLELEIARNTIWGQIADRIRFMVSNFNLETNSYSRLTEGSLKNGPHLEIEETELFDITNLILSLLNFSEFRKDHLIALNCLKLIFFFFHSELLNFGQLFQACTGNSLPTKGNKLKMAVYSKLVYLWLLTEISKNLNALGKLEDFKEWTIEAWKLRGQISREDIDKYSRAGVKLVVISTLDLIELYPDSVSGEDSDDQVVDKIDRTDTPSMNKKIEIRKVIKLFNSKFSERKKLANSMHYFCSFIRILTTLLKYEKCVFEKSKLIKELFRCLDI